MSTFEDALPTYPLPTGLETVIVPRASSVGRVEGAAPCQHAYERTLGSIRSGYDAGSQTSSTSALGGVVSDSVV
jgi:hypothetical protein